MSLQQSAEFTRCSAPIKTSSLPAGAYVLSLASLTSSYAAASSSPTNAIHLYDKSDFRTAAQLAGHEDAITCMRAVTNVSGTAREALVSCGKDGIIKVWDERSGSASLQMHALTAGRKRALLSCDISPDGLTVAAGTDLHADDASILYWDPRNPVAPLRAHTYTHSDDITAIHFLRSEHSHSLPHNVLLSASTDGLVCTSNADEPDEDEAGLHVANWGCSVAQTGWISGRSGSAAIWSSSDMETFGVWTGELDPVHDGDIRQPSIHRQDFTWVTDYLIGCHNSKVIPSQRDNDLNIFVGSNEGDIALISKPTFSDTNASWSFDRLWSTGHVGVVRSFLWDEGNNILLTGGEDSKINVWPCPPHGSASSDALGGKRETDSYDMDVDEEDGVPRRKKRRS